MSNTRTGTVGYEKAKGEKWEGRTEMRARLQVVALVLTMLFIAGCGGSSGKTGSTNAGSTGPATTGAAPIAPAVSTGASNGGVSTSAASGKALSGSQLVAKADSVCGRLNAELVAAKNTYRNQQDVLRIASQRAAIEQAATIELSKLTPPASMAHDYQLIVAGMRSLAESTAQIGRDAATHNTQGERLLLISGATVARQMAVTAAHGGFRRCGRLD